MRLLSLTSAERALVQSWRELLTPLGCEAKLHSKAGLCGKQASHVHVNDPGYQPWQQPHPRALIPVCYHHAHVARIDPETGEIISDSESGNK